MGGDRTASFSASVGSVTTSSARFRASFSGGDSNYTRYRYVLLELSNGDSYEIRSSSSGGASSSFSKTVSGLDANTTYSWTATLGYDADGSIVWLSLSDSGSFRTLSASLNVTPWSWSSSNGEATTTMTQNAYKVVNGTITADNFSHYVWNDLVNKVMEVRAAKGYAWDSNGGTTQSGAKVSAGESLSAKKFNSVKYNIGTIRGTFANVSPGDEILGSYFTRLTDVLNDIIKNP